ncbi:MAG: hypothetical protein ACI8PG_003522, partial [Planctomycetota bacterium]
MKLGIRRSHNRPSILFQIDKMSENTTTGYLNMDLLRFTTAGSVDDGKSTLI